MEEVVVRGVPVRTWKSAPPNLRTVFELSAGHADKTFLVYEDERITFGEHFRTVAALGHQLVERFGVRPGDRVAIAMRNLPEWVMAFWATITVGAVAVPLNAWWTGEELAYGLADSGTRVAFVDEERQGRIVHHLAEVPDLEALIVSCEEHDPDGGGRRAAVGSVLDRGALGALPVLPFAEVVGLPDDDIALVDVDIDPDDDATIFYTSGTTGRPKGAVGTHRNSVSNLMNLFFVSTLGGMRRTAAAGRGLAGGAERQPAVRAAVPCHRLPRAARHQHGGRRKAGDDAPLRPRAGPRAHRAGADHRLRGCARHGHAGHRLPRLRQAGHVLGPVDLLRRRPVPTRPGAPDQGALPDRRPRQRLRPHRDVGHDHHERRRRLRAQARQRRTAGTGVRRRRRARGLAGRRAAATSRPIPDRTGELWIQGPNVVRGYWNKPEATAASFTRGWLHTGRRRPHRRGGLRPHRRPGEGHDHPGRRERLLRRDRSRPCTSTRPSPTAP